MMDPVLSELSMSWMKGQISRSDGLRLGRHDEMTQGPSQRRGLMRSMDLRTGLDDIPGNTLEVGCYRPCI